MSRRNLSHAVYLGLAILLVLVGRLLFRGGPAGPGAFPQSPSFPSDPSAAASAVSSAASPPDDADTSAVQAVPLRRPQRSVVTLGILTSLTDQDLSSWISRDSIAQLVSPRYCGNDEACDAVRATLRDESATTVDVMRVADWMFEPSDADPHATGLSPAERASLPARSRVVVITVAAPTSPSHLALRAGLAGTAALADRIDGFVQDPLLGRLETSRQFAAHVVTTPLGASAFRRDRIELLREPKQPGIERVLTAGLSRWGAPDIEAARVPVIAEAPVAEVVLAVAQAVSAGAAISPCLVSREDIDRARGQKGATSPASSPVPIDLVSIHPEAGDPNDFIARIDPPAGDGPLGYVELAERFFGPLLGTPPRADALDERRERTQRELGGTLSRWDASRTQGTRLLVRLPFPIPGDAGLESMWVEVSAYDAKTVTGRLDDDPLGATDVARGDWVTRPRAQIEDVRLTR